MPKVFLAENVNGQVLLKGFVSGGTILKFSYTGKFTESAVFTASTRAHTTEVDVISILVVNSEIEIALNINEQFVKFSTSMSLGDIISFCNKLTSIKFSGLRDDVCSGTPFKQFIYALEKGSVKLEYLIGGLH